MYRAFHSYLCIGFFGGGDLSMKSLQLIIRIVRKTDFCLSESKEVSPWNDQ